ncbi:MAG: hypothetical protein IJH39_12455 [Clostridia bacterium]|nr:hypothetical protein [Clostridia bacterium]
MLLEFCKRQKEYIQGCDTVLQVIEQICELNNIYYTILVPHNIIGPRQKEALMEPF